MLSKWLIFSRTLKPIFISSNKEGQTAIKIIIIIIILQMIVFGFGINIFTSNQYTNDFSFLVVDEI